MPAPAARPPQIPTILEPPSKIKFVALGLVLLTAIGAGIWNLSRPEKQPPPDITDLSPRKFEPSPDVTSMPSVPERTFTGQDGTIADITFSPDGKLLASASADSTVKPSEQSLLKVF